MHLFKYFRPDFTGDGLYLEKLDPLLQAHGVVNTVAAEITRGPSSRPGQARPSFAVRLFGTGRHGTFNPLLLLWFTANAWRFDVVHVHSAIDRHFLYHLIARLFLCRVVHSCTLEDGLGTLVQGYRPAYRRLVRLLCRAITDVVAISPRLYDDSLQVARPDRLHLIPQGVLIPSLHQNRGADRARFGYGPDDVVLLFVGGMCARKDVRFLVDQLPSSTGQTHLLLVGPTLEDEYGAELTAAIAASPGRARIQLIGAMDDPTPAYRAADIFVFASRAEGFGNVLLEAMAHALPVVCRRLPGVTDSFIEHDRTGLLFDDAAGYDRAVASLLTDPVRRAALGDAARESVAAQYNLHEIAARYAALYRTGA